MDFSYSLRTQELQARVSAFMAEHIYPAEPRYFAEIEANTRAGKRWTPLQLIEELKPKARAAGLWNLFLPPSAEGAHTHVRAEGSSAKEDAEFTFGFGLCAGTLGTGVAMRAIGARRQEQVPQTSGSCLELELFNQLQGCPAFASTRVGFNFSEVTRLCRVDVFGHEGRDTGLQILGAGGIAEVHGCLRGKLRNALRNVCLSMGLLSKGPGHLGQGPRGRTRGLGLCAGCDAVHHALGNALRDGGQAEEVVGEVEIPVSRQCFRLKFARAVGADTLTDSFAIPAHILCLCGNAQRDRVESANAAEGAGRNMPSHAVVAEVSQRVADG